MGQEGYGNASAYQAVEDNGSSLEQSIVQYEERATTEEAQVSDLESRLAALEMVNQHPPIVSMLLRCGGQTLLVSLGIPTTSPWGDLHDQAF